MSEIKVLNKLRAYSRNTHAEGFPYEGSLLHQIADEIQAEVDERFMELPYDKDGVPIRVGDEVEYKCDEDTYTLHARGIYVYDDGSVGVMNERLGIWYPKACRHVKPRTLEDVLCEFAIKFQDDNESTGITDDVVDKYAAEIRELLGVDA